MAENSGKKSRRDVLKMGAAAGAVGLTPLRVAGQTPQVKAFRAPEDKGLTGTDYRRLRRRGRPTLYMGKEREFIGMPIGGLCAGQIYLGSDGQLWHWDIFNQPGNTRNDTVYVTPLEAKSEVKQGFSVSWKGESIQGERNLDSDGFKNHSFRGQYPFAEVFFEDDSLPVEASLKAYSPFCPLETEESSHPATCFIYRLTNRSDEELEISVSGFVENRVLSFSKPHASGRRVNQMVDSGSWAGQSLSATIDPPQETESNEPEVFEDWSHGSYRGWKVEGTAFGESPQRVKDMPSYMGEITDTTEFIANTHQTRNGEDVVEGDNHLGSLTSGNFTIDRPFISMKVGGGSHKGKTCINLLVEGEVALSIAGKNSNKMGWQHFDVRSLKGKQASIQVLDDQKGGWGQISIGEIWFTDEPMTAPVSVDRLGDWGTMCLIAEDGDVRLAESANLGGKLPMGTASSTKTLKPGESAEFRFILAWHFPNPWRDSIGFITGIKDLNHWYAKQWKDAQDVAFSLASRFDELHDRTELWRETWYGGSMPNWFLERTFINTSIMASATCYRFDNDRFYGWEGNYCCAGTCTHVWGYAQSSGRVFPELERSLRQQVDFGVSWRENGAIDYRGEAGQYVAHDGQCTVLLRTYREHLMSKDDSFLKSIWPRVKGSLQHLINEDGGQDGLFEGRQYNTLDATWWGPMGWISSLYIAALAAGAKMAKAMGDTQFEAVCTRIASSGKTKIVDELFNGEYFIHNQDMSHPESNGTGPGCHIDQVFGQSWAHQTGLGDVIPKEECRSALKSLYRYSFLPDVGPYRTKIDSTIKGGRWYAMPGEGGLVMCSWPKGGTEFAVGKGGDAWAAMYFNECMHGFEYQVAAHMMAEDMVSESLAICRSVHDRYQGHKRNPFNEIECGTHYARSMASHGVFLMACGFELDGPAGIIGFAPKMNQNNFEAAWIGPEGWGVYRQTTGDFLLGEIEVRYGRLEVEELRLPNSHGQVLQVKLDGEAIDAEKSVDGSTAQVRFGKRLKLEAGQTLSAMV